MVKKGKARGWEYIDRWSDDAARELSVRHRTAKENEGLTNVLADLAVHFAGEPGYSLAIERKHSEDAVLVVKLKDVGDVTVAFRYGRLDLGRRGTCDGISVQAYDRHVGSLGRTYGFDFDAMRMTPAATEKLAIAVKYHLGCVKRGNEKRTADAAAVKAHTTEAMERLTTAGYTVERTHGKLQVPGVAAFTVRVDGYVEVTVPVRASVEDIVAVAAAIKALKGLNNGH